MPRNEVVEGRDDSGSRAASMFAVGRSVGRVRQTVARPGIRIAETRRPSIEPAGHQPHSRARGRSRARPSAPRPDPDPFARDRIGAPRRGQGTPQARDRVGEDVKLPHRAPAQHNARARPRRTSRAPPRRRCRLPDRARSRPGSWPSPARRKRFRSRVSAISDRLRPAALALSHKSRVDRDAHRLLARVRVVERRSHDVVARMMYMGQHCMGQPHLCQVERVGHDHPAPHPRRRRHHRRRHRRLLDRLSPDQARHHRRRCCWSAGSSPAARPGTRLG